MPISRVFLLTYLVLVVVEVGLLLTQHYGRADQIANILFIYTFGIGLWKIFAKSSAPASISGTSHPSYKKPWLISLAILLIIFNNITFTSFTNAGNDTNFLTQEALKSISKIPQTWESFFGGVDLGHNQIINMWMQPLLALLSLAGNAGISFSIIVKAIVWIQLGIGTYGLSRLLRKWNIPPLAVIAANVFYFANTYLLTIVDGGLIFLSEAYAIFPLILYQFWELIEDFNLTRLVKLTLILILGQSLDFRILPLFLICFVILALILIKTRRTFFHFLFSFIWISVFLTGWNMFWIWPAVKSQVPINFSYTNFYKVS